MSTALQTHYDINYFSELPAEVRAEVKLWLEVIKTVDQAKSLEKGAATAAAQWGHRRGFSKHNIKRKVRAFRKLGWQSLIDRAKVGKTNAALSIGEHFKRYCQENQRSSREAYRAMMRDFHGGKYFEDLGTWRDVYSAQHPDTATPFNCPYDWTPRGWTYRNLMRSCGLTEYEVKATRIGRGAARDHLPAVYSTRADLLVGQIYQFDDMWHDAKVNSPGNRRAQRVIELAAVDVASACRFAYGLKPRREDLETGKMKNLNDCDMRQILAHVLINIGYHPDGCRMIVEHGTAAASSELEQLLKALSNGAVSFERSGIISDPIHKGLYCGQPRGNYKLKASLESQHSLAHNVAAALKGQIGKDRDHSPEQMYGLEQYNTQLIKAAAALPPERAKLLMMPLLDFNTYCKVITDLYREMNFRRWHNLEGWEEAGYVATQYRTGPTSNDWLPMDHLLELPTDEYRMLYGLIQASPEKFSRTIRLAPQEVFDVGRQCLVRLPKSCMPQILGERLAVLKELRSDGLITYSNRDFGPSEFRYIARTVTDVRGFEIPLSPGRQYAVHINPFNVEECFVSDAQSGAYIGLARRWQTVCKTDTAALERQAGKQAHIEKELLTPIARRGQKILKEKTDMHRHNAKILGGAPIVDGGGAPVDKKDVEAVLAHKPDMRPEIPEEEISDLLRDERSDVEGVDLSDLFND